MKLNFEDKSFKILKQLLLLIVTIISIFLGAYIISEPPLPADFKDKIITMDEINDKNAPSLDMAMSHVYNISQKPHPSGSEEILRVRKYILGEIEKMGLKYEIQSFERNLLAEELSNHRKETTDNAELREFRDNYAKEKGFETYEEFIEYSCPGNTEYQNILVKIAPANPTHSFLMVAHYDSAQQAPAAADDGVSVASLLETMRILSNQDDMKNAIYFLITDGEETGSVGADYYCKNPIINPDTIDLVVNFEARGNQGVPIMFQASDNNKKIIKIISDKISKKWVFSYSPALYKIMHYSTDLTNFFEANYSGANFAMGSGAESYHRASDNYENLSRKSANQYLETAIGLSNYFKNVSNFDIQSNEDAIAFPYWNGETAVFSNSIMKIFASVASILVIVFIAFLIMKKQAKVKSALISFGLILLNLALAYPMFALKNKLVDALPILRKETIGLAVIIAFALFTTLTLGFVAKKFIKIQNSEIKIASLLIFVLLTIGTATLFNSVSYIFSIPLLFMLIAYGAEKITRNKALSVIAQAILILVSCVIFVPSLMILQIAMPSYIYVIFIFSILSLLPILTTLINVDENHLNVDN